MIAAGLLGREQLRSSSGLDLRADLGSQDGQAVSEPKPTGSVEQRVVVIALGGEHFGCGFDLEEVFALDPIRREPNIAGSLAMVSVPEATRNRVRANRPSVSKREGVRHFQSPVGSVHSTVKTVAGCASPPAVPGGASPLMMGGACAS